MDTSPAALAAHLREMELFTIVPEPILLELAKNSNVTRHPAGEVVFLKNEPGRSLYLILSGAAKVHDEDYVVATMQEGSYFGEMALLDDGPRSMSVTVTEPSLLLHIDREAFFEVLGDYPEVAQGVVGLLTRRLRFLTDRIVEHLRRREEELVRLVDDRTAELVRQKEEAEHLRRRAEQSEQFEQQFLANMSHEIRTPMNAVLGMTNLLLQKNPREDQLKYLTGIRQSSEALLVILNDILDISKIQAGKLELETTDLYLENILQAVHDTLQFRAAEKKLQLQVYCDPDIPTCLRGDPVRLRQILLNLAGNAVKFTEEGYVTLRAKRLEGADAQHCRLLLEVQDTGIGMTPEQLAVVFESFRQASGDTTRRYGGTGLGLSISKQLVELFDSHIEVQSSPGAGSTFRFALDLPIGETAPATARPPAGGSAESLRGLRVLLAEDNPFNRLVAVETLELLVPGLYIRTVENGRDALASLRAEAFDVVLMDVSMPVMDGWEATAILRTLPPPLCHIPVVAFTASVTQKEVKKCFDAGMNTYVPKPFRENELLDALLAVKGAAAPPAEVQPAAAVPLQLDFLEKLAGGNPERLQKYLRLYLDSATGSLPNIAAALAAADPQALRRAVHTLKPQFKMVGLPELADLAQAIENHALEKNDVAGVREKTEQLLAEIRASVSRFETYLQQNSNNL